MREESIPVYEISADSRDLAETNKRIDKAIKARFLGQRICIRVLDSSVHTGKTIGELIAIIKQTGTDRYDSSIRSDRYYNQEDKHIDFFALDFTVNPESVILDEFTWRKKLRPPLKIDIVIIYDISQVERIPYTPIGRTDQKPDGFAFNTSKKSNAIKAIFKVFFD